MAGAVLAGGDWMEVLGRRRGGSLGYEIMQGCGRRNGGYGLEEGATLEGHWLMVREVLRLRKVINLLLTSCL